MYYVVPLIIFSVWLSVVTYLHHTHKDTILYGDSAWSFYKGALMTVDRSYGRLIDFLHHNMETHMVHHMFFTSIPHYHIKAATAALKEQVGVLAFPLLTLL